MRYQTSTVLLAASLSAGALAQDASATQLASEIASFASGILSFSTVTDTAVLLPAYTAILSFEASVSANPEAPAAQSILATDSAGPVVVAALSLASADSASIAALEASGGASAASSTGGSAPSSAAASTTEMSSSAPSSTDGGSGGGGGVSIGCTNGSCTTAGVSATGSSSAAHSVRHGSSHFSLVTVGLFGTAAMGILGGAILL